MTDLPQGTVTFLFTDIEGSTRLWEQHADAMSRAMSRHDELIRKAAESHRGAIYKVVGDGYQIAFPTAPDGLSAALAAQLGLASEQVNETVPLRVRMALHTGIAEPQADGDFRTPELNRLGRLLVAAHGGQILLSAATQELVRDHLPAGATLRDLGQHQLRDLYRPERIYQLIYPDLEPAFPPIKTLAVRPHNLPIQPTQLIGREREVAAVRALLERPDVRLVTLTGPGGTGKTRLSLQVAADLIDAFEDGVWWVPLAAVSNPDLLPSAIALALGIKETSSQPLLEMLRDHLAEQEILLLLDNFEQIVSAAGGIAELLAECPRLKVLATSRVRLQLRGEREFLVPPLELPDPKRLSDLDILTQFEAVRLFIQSAAAVKPDFAVTNANAPAVAEICHRLDGLPLAIELAAARVKMLPPDRLLARLDQRLKVLTGGARDLPIRHQTLRNAIAWSYDLLSDEERELFLRLGTFSGGCTLESAEAIAGVDCVDILDGLSSLTDKSLLRRDEREAAEPCFIMLETIREYAVEQLNASGQADEAYRRHGEHFLELAELANDELAGPDQRLWLERLEAEHDNLRVALARAAERGDAETALRFGAALGRFWETRGHLTEGRLWLERVLFENDLGSPLVRAGALHVLGLIAWAQSEYQRAMEAHTQALTLHRQFGSKTEIGSSLNRVGVVELSQGNYGRANALFDEALTLAREESDQKGLAVCLGNLGIVAALQDEDDKAMQLFDESLDIERKLGNVRGIAFSLNNMGALARGMDDLERANTLYEEAMVIWRELGDTSGASLSLQNLAQVQVDRGELAQATKLYTDVLGMVGSLDDRLRTASVLEGLGSVGQRSGHAARAVPLLASAAALREAIGAPLPPPNREANDEVVAAVRSDLGEETFGTLWASASGRSLAETLADAVDAAGEMMKSFASGSAEESSHS